MPDWRRTLTFAMCCVIVTGWAILLAFVAVAAISTMAGRFLPSGFAAAGVAFLFLSTAVGWALSFWRRCDLCGDFLFPLSAVVLSRRFVDERVLDQRAKTLFGAYRRAAILEQATTGKLHCVWCWHVDGSSQETLVIHPE